MIAMIAETIPDDIRIVQHILPLAAALLIGLVTFELIRRRKLCEEYAVLWVLASIVLVVFALFPKLLWYISEVLDLFYLTTLVLMCFGFLALVVLHLSVVISRSMEDNRRFAQRMAMLERKVEQLSGGKKEDDPAESD